MAKIIKCEVCEFPEVYVLGKQITVPVPNTPETNPIPKFWEECFSDDIFEHLMEHKEYLFNDAYVGWMSDYSEENGIFTYICGMLVKSDLTIQVDGFVSRTIEPATVGIGWIQGTSTPEVCFAAHSLMEKALTDIGYSCKNPVWCMEVYNCPRFTQPDENGNIILDYYVPCVQT
nr:effector binding domain-containing protein [uncultured Methanospirillum sp.]